MRPVQGRASDMLKVTGLTGHAREPRLSLPTPCCLQLYREKTVLTMRPTTSTCWITKKQEGMIQPFTSYIPVSFQLLRFTLPLSCEQQGPSEKAGGRGHHPLDSVAQGRRRHLSLPQHAPSGKSCMWSFQISTYRSAQPEDRCPRWYFRGRTFKKSSCVGGPKKTVEGWTAPNLHLLSACTTGKLRSMVGVYLM